MADHPPLDDLLDRASNIFTLAGKLASSFLAERENRAVGRYKLVGGPHHDGKRTYQQGDIVESSLELDRMFANKFERLPNPSTIDRAAAWDRCEPTFREFWNSLLDIREPMRCPPDDFTSIAGILRQATITAKKIRELGPHDPSFLDFFPDLNTVLFNGSTAIEKAKKLHDPFAFVDELAGGDTAKQRFTLIDQFAATPAGHVKFLEFVRDEVHQAAEAKRQQFARNYSNDTLASMVGGIKWDEARHRVAVLPDAAAEQVSRVLRRELTIGTVEHIDDLLLPAVRALRDALEDAKQGSAGVKPAAKSAPFEDLIGVAIRRLKAKPDLLRGYVWDRPETLNVNGINAAAETLGLGPVFEIGKAADWGRFPNLPSDHPANQHKVECLTVYHPNGSEYEIRRDRGVLDDRSSLPVEETIARLEAWVKRGAEVSRHIHATNRFVEVASAGDLWKALSDGFRPVVAVSTVSFGPQRSGINVVEPTFPAGDDQQRQNVLDAAMAHVEADGGDPAAVMKKLIARVALKKGITRPAAINLPLAEFVEALKSSAVASAGTATNEASPIAKMAEPDKGTSTESQDSANAAKKSKRSTERGEGRAKLVAALTKHHKYADGSCLNLAPIGNNKLARLAEVSESTASAFFEEKFRGHAKYRVSCRDPTQLVAALKLLNQEFSPHHLFGAKPPSEDDHDDEK